MKSMCLHWSQALALMLMGCSLGANARPPTIDVLPRINDPFAAAVWRLDVDDAERVVAVGLASNSIALYW